MKSLSIVTFLSIALIISLSSFTSNTGRPANANKPKVEAANVTTPATLDIDVNAFMASLGFATQVDEKQLEAQYPSVSVAVNTGSNVEIKFADPTAQEYRLDIYDINGNILVTYIDIYGDTVKIDERFVGAFGSYLYKLSGEGNTYAGKFSAQLP
jgi:hypothetical protein